MVIRSNKWVYFVVISVNVCIAYVFVPFRSVPFRSVSLYSASIYFVVCMLTILIVSMPLDGLYRWNCYFASLYRWSFRCMAGVKVCFGRSFHKWSYAIHFHWISHGLWIVQHICKPNFNRHIYKSHTLPNRQINSQNKCGPQKLQVGNATIW